MAHSTDVRIAGATLFFLSAKLRTPLKFGAETVQQSTTARVRVRVKDAGGRSADGWGETPLGAAWSWPGASPSSAREEAMQQFCLQLARAWSAFAERGHPMEIGHAFLEHELPRLLREFNRARSEPMPHLAALVCCSAFDLAVHDAFGMLHGIPVYQTYNRSFMNADLAHYLEPAEGCKVSFTGKFPADSLIFPRPDSLPVWHLVGGKDPLDDSELTGSEPRDDYPVLLRDWIRRDGLKCLKIKLRGNDPSDTEPTGRTCAAWDYDRIVRIGRVSIEKNVEWLSADFNCTVRDPDYVNRVLDRLKAEQPRVFEMLLYVEQPFPYDLEANRLDVRSLSARKPLFMDESAHDWRLVRLGRSLGWTGVALKTCKTQTGALLSLCWAKAHGMALMVQDLTNPMLATVPHVLLAAHAGTIMGVESNAPQYLPDASRPEEQVHPGLYRRRQGSLDLRSLRGPGFGYRIAEIRRELPPPAFGEA
jgi:L-alanine-DL-glutamate epimerase-like enolase superfamily enzyme